MLLLRRLLSSRGARVTLALFALWLGFQGWMLFEAPRRVEKGLIERAERDGAVNVVVRLAFPPERFHVLKIMRSGQSTACLRSNGERSRPSSGLSPTRGMPARPVNVGSRSMAALICVTV